RGLVNKLLHDPVVRGKQLATGPDGDLVERLLRDLFGLGGPPAGQPRGERGLATRGSPLARAQAGLVAATLRAAWPGLEVRLIVVVTEGDRPFRAQPGGSDGVRTEGPEARDASTAALGVGGSGGPEQVRVPRAIGGAGGAGQGRGPR